MFSSWPVCALVAGVKIGSGSASLSRSPGGKLDAAHRARLLIFFPAGARQIAARHAFDVEHIRALHPHRAAFEFGREARHIRAEQMIGHGVAQQIEPEKAHLRQHAPFFGDAGGQDVIEGRNAVGGDNQQPLRMLRIFINVADFAAAAQFQSGDVGF